MFVKLRKINDIVQYDALVGLKGMHDGIDFRIYEYSTSDGKLLIALDVYKTGRNEITETISSLMGEERMLKTLEANFGVIIEIVESFSFSQEAKTKAQGLALAGYSKLTKQEENYSVDNEFVQKFLTQEELSYFLSRGVQEIDLSEII